MTGFQCPNTDLALSDFAAFWDMTTTATDTEPFGGSLAIWYSKLISDASYMFWFPEVTVEERQLNTVTVHGKPKGKLHVEPRKPPKYSHKPCRPVIMCGHNRSWMGKRKQ